MAEGRRNRAPQPTLRHRVHLILEAGQGAGLGGQIFEYFLVILIIANVLAVTLESVPSIRAVYHAEFGWLEIFTVIVFTIEYALRLWSAPEDPRVANAGPVVGRLRYMLQPLMLVDLLAVAPIYIAFFMPFLDLRVLRIFRLLRLFKIVRYSPALTTLVDVISAERRALFGTFLLLLCVMSVSAEIMYGIEGSVQPKVFGTLPDAMWWSITTLTTVGYGDAVPITVFGKFVAALTMVCGLGLFALPVGIVATGFVNEIHRREFVITWGMLAHMPLFEGFGVDVIGDAMNALRSQVIREHMPITIAGQPAQSMYFIVSGEARAEKDLVSYSLGPGDFFGEAALLHRQPYETTITARTPMRVLTLASHDFEHLVRKHPKFKTRVLKAAARKEERLRARIKRAQAAASDPEPADAGIVEIEDPGAEAVSVE